VKGDVVGVEVVGLDCEGNKDRRGLSSSDPRLPSVNRQLDLVATITEDSRNHRVLL